MAIASINPATEETLQSFDALSAEEIERRLDQAHRTSASWRDTPIAHRLKILARAAELLEERKRAYGRLMTLEMGKPIKAAVEEAAKCALGLRYYAQHA